MAQPLLGADYYTVMTSLVSGFQMDPVLFYQLLNTARIQREMQRPFRYLAKLDTSNTVQPVSTLPLVSPPPVSYVIPSDFNYLSQDGQIMLYNSAGNIYEPYYEIPFEKHVEYLQYNNKFFFDFTANKLYFLGIIDRAYIAYIFYQADLGDITATTQWVNIPSRFHMILAFDVAAMYRLGVDYDDINARNADNNHQQAEALFEAMKNWDDNLQRSSVTTLERPGPSDGSPFVNHKINMNG